MDQLVILLCNNSRLEHLVCSPSRNLSTEIISNSVGKCYDLLKAEELDHEGVNYNDECMTLVKLPHMMHVIPEEVCP